MNKTLIILGIIIIVAMVGVVATNSTNNDSKPATDDANSNTVKNEKPTEGANGESETETPVTATDNLSYEAVTTMDGKKISSSNVWMKGKKMKTETKTEGQTGVVIIDGDKQSYITYTVGDKKAYKIDYGSQEVPETPLNAEEVSNENSQGDDLVTENLSDETVDGKSCSVTKHSLPGSDDYTQIWIWKEKNLMVKTETKSGQTIMTIEYKNLEVNKVKDSDFDLPKGVELVDMMENLPGM